MKVLSLFDGISCGRLALERAGIKVDAYYASEIDENAIKVSKHNFSDIMHIGDVNNVNFSNYKNVDLIFGGFPCQDLSIANMNRKGLTGTRSGLFFKLLEAIETIKPKWFLVENVASMSKESKKLISEKLNVESILIDSAQVCAQSRKRLYWTNIPLKLENIVKDNSKMYLFQILESKHNIDFPSDKMKILNPKSGKNHSQPSLQDRIYDISGKMPTLTTSFHPNIAEPVTEIKPFKYWTIKNKIIEDFGNKGRNYSINLPDGNYYIRKCTPLEFERLQTLPDNYTNCVNKTARYQLIGNAWTVNVIEWFMKSLSSN